MRHFTLLNKVLKGVGLMLLFLSAVFAESIDVWEFPTQAQERRYHVLINEIRCPVCQGQSIGGSNAGLAKDLRERVYNMLVESRSDDEIRKFMTDRYGDFVIFKPPVNVNTYLLWFAPFAFLVLGLWFFIRLLGNKRSASLEEVNTEKAKKLLK